MSNSSSGVFDSTETHDYFFTVSERIYVTVEAAFWFRFREFWAPATTVVSGGGSSPTTEDGGSSSPTTEGGGDHSHQMFNHVGNEHTSATVKQYQAKSVGGGSIPVNLDTFGSGNLYTWEASGTHTHGVTVPSHTHGVTVPAHAHGLQFGIYKEPMPATINVNVALWRKPFVGGTWELFGSISGLTDTEEHVDLTSWFRDDPSGLWRLTFQSAAGQPNGGRLTVDVAHDAWGAIKSS